MLFLRYLSNDPLWFESFYVLFQDLKTPSTRSGSTMRNSYWTCTIIDVIFNNLNDWQGYPPTDGCHQQSFSMKNAETRKNCLQSPRWVLFCLLLIKMMNKFIVPQNQLWCLNFQFRYEKVCLNRSIHKSFGLNLYKNDERKIFVNKIGSKAEGKY